MDPLPESARYEGLEVILLFKDDGPTFGDLFTICGYENPHYPPPGRFDFLQFEDLQFSQVDDYFGVQTQSRVGDDVSVWLYPLIEGEAMDHHPGPFDGLALGYNILRNPIERSEHFLKCISRLAAGLPVSATYRGAPLDLDQIKQDLQDIHASWLAEGITVGSHEALTLDY